MTLTVNGEKREIAQGATIQTLIESLNLKARNVAVELNRRIVRSDRYTTELKDGDAVEIVTFVGGG